jgi:hypothetical protein
MHKVRVSIALVEALYRVSFRLMSIAACKTLTGNYSYEYLVIVIVPTNLPLRWTAQHCSMSRKKYANSAMYTANTGQIILVTGGGRGVGEMVRFRPHSSPNSKSVPDHRSRSQQVTSRMAQRCVSSLTM